MKHIIQCCDWLTQKLLHEEQEGSHIMPCSPVHVKNGTKLHKGRHNMPSNYKKNSQTSKKGSKNQFFRGGGVSIYKYHKIYSKKIKVKKSGYMFTRTFFLTQLVKLG